MQAYPSVMIPPDENICYYSSPEQWPLPTPYLETRGNKIMNATRKGLRNLSIQESIKGLRVIIRKWSDSTLPQGHTETLSIIK